jgi:hypothetical protein
MSLRYYITSLGRRLSAGRGRFRPGRSEPPLASRTSWFWGRGWQQLEAEGRAAAVAYIHKPADALSHEQIALTKQSATHKTQPLSTANLELEGQGDPKRIRALGPQRQASRSSGCDQGAAVSLPQKPRTRSSVSKKGGWQGSRQVSAGIEGSHNPSLLRKLT